FLTVVALISVFIMLRCRRPPRRGKPPQAPLTSPAVGVLSDAEGRFRFVARPGPGVLAATVIGTTESADSLYDPYLVNPYKPAELDPDDRKSPHAAAALNRNGKSKRVGHSGSLA